MGALSGKIVRLNKSLYGLRQASRTFNKRLVVDLKRIGFEQCLSDPCVLRFMMGDEVLGMVVIHVDDILFGGCLLYTSPSPRDLSTSRMPSSA